jgi:ABC-type Fe2+-enterobactin transport system substrate-binding protein
LHNTEQNNIAGTMCSTPNRSRTLSPQRTSLVFSVTSKSKIASDREILELYAEELFVDEQHLAEDDADAQQAASSTGRGAAIQARQARPAQSPTLLFDIAEFSGPVS